MREHAFGVVTTAVLVLTLAFAATMSWMTYTGLLATLRALCSPLLGPVRSAELPGRWSLSW